MIGLGAYRRMGRFQCYIYTCFVRPRFSRDFERKSDESSHVMYDIFTYAGGVVVTYKALFCTNLRRDVPQKLEFMIFIFAFTKHN